MTLLHEAVEAKKFDVRVIERHVRRGVISHADASRAAEQLPDDSENADWVSIDSLAEEGSRPNINASSSQS